MQQLQAERHKQSAQLQQSESIQTEQEQRIIELEQKQVDSHELQDALVEAHTSLEEQTTALRVRRTNAQEDDSRQPRMSRAKVPICFFFLLLVRL